MRSGPAILRFKRSAAAFSAAFCILNDRVKAEAAILNPKLSAETPETSNTHSIPLPDVLFSILVGSRVSRFADGAP